MSLDVSLDGPAVTRECECVNCGNIHQATGDGEVYSANITHNLNKMADAAGLYEPLWRPEELGITKASELIDPLRAGLGRLVAAPEKFTPLNPTNGWGDYDSLVRFVRAYLAACVDNPDATVSVSR